MKNSKNAQLRALLQQPDILRAVGAGDPWDAKLIEQAGFSAVYMSGAFVSHITLGRPDIGLATQSEMVNAARKIAAAVSVPVIADGDNGFGGVLNVMRTVMEYEQAGVSAIQLEDQVFPKRCGHMEGKALITREEMEAKIRAAAKARQDPDFVIIARTDARAVNGFEDAIARAKAYADAGADVIFFEAPQSEDEMRQLNKLIGKPTLANMVMGGKTPQFTGKELEQMGYKIVIYPIDLLQVSGHAVKAYLTALKEQDTAMAFKDQMMDFQEFNAVAGLPEERALEKAILEG